MKKIVTFIALMFGIIGFAGCKGQSRPADLPPLVPCVVSVIQDAKPLEGAIVNFVGADGSNSKYQATGVTNSEGKATLSTYGYEGVPEGKYKVCIWKNLTEGVEQIENADGEMVSTDGVEYRTVDMQYFSADSTPFEITVTGKEMEEKSFDVGESIKELK
ncbi:MAG: hypothetical protein Q4C95_09120 [Planctomycetia bacterium]|nr:hypothetical protein [Planctomycetia bacterium]